MVVRVVPILRLRRATAWWSYITPLDTPCPAGSLVGIPFRGATCLGVVWGVEDSPPAGKKLSTITQVITKQPLIRAPQRQFIEWLAEYGLCSLSTALYTCMPQALRGSRITKPAQAILSDHSLEITAAEITARKQHAVLNPSQRPDATAALAKKYSGQFTLLEYTQHDNLGLMTWLGIANGDYRIAVGREHVVFAPWLNLRHLTVIEPEDISYYHEQIPYIPMVDAAKQLAEIHHSQYSVRSNIPHAAAQALWGESALGTTIQAVLEVIDLRRNELLNETLLDAIREVHASRKNVLILYNAHDRIALKDSGERVVIPGIETVRKRLAHALGYKTLPASITLGTRAIFKDQHRNVGLGVILSIDPLLGNENLADQIHGWGDIGRLLSTTPRCIIQARQMDHALVSALRNASFEAYCCTALTTAKAQGLPPFAEHIVCSVPITFAPESLQTVHARLAEQAKTPWHVSEPFEANRRGQKTLNVLLVAPQQSRLPAPLLTYLSALPRPWKIQRNPWYAL